MDKMKLFVIWLDGYMAACGPVMTEDQTSVVKDKLNNLFEHVAEPVEIVSTSGRVVFVHTGPAIAIGNSS